LWFFRLLEREDGRRSCRRGRDEIGSDSGLADALSHIRSLAAMKPAEQDLAASPRRRCARCHRRRP